jgi:radical SAM protein with 4Fe4S-binding SPASM domain
MWRYSRGHVEGIPGPGALMIETTVRCNLLCPMCPRTGAGYPNEDMPDELLYNLVDDFAAMGGDHIYLYGLGEPLMDPRIFDLLERCRALDIGTVLSTNATFLNAKRRAKLLAAGCDHLLIGIDGATEETYSYYRAGGKYKNVVANVRALAAEKHAAGSAMTIAVQFIQMARNIHETDAFLAQWQGVPGIDLVRIKQEDIGLEEHRTLEVDGHQRQNACHTLWRGPMVVRYNGQVFPCYHIAENGEPVGDLNHQRLPEVWESPQMRELRGLHASKSAADNPHCATCPAARPRLPFVMGAMALRGTTVRRLVPVAERVALKMPWLFSENRTPLS